jgi:hypothetical protein
LFLLVIFSINNVKDLIFYSEQLSFDAEPPLKKSRSFAESDNGKLSVEIKEEKLIIENSADNTLNMEEVMLKI